MQSITRLKQLFGLLAITGLLAMAGCSDGGSDRVPFSVSGGGTGSTGAGISSNSKFVQVQDMTTPRAHHTATALPNGKVVIAGGQIADAQGNQSVSDTVEIFDESTGTFHTIGSRLSSPRVGHTATLIGPKVVIAGGQNALNGGAQQTIDIYNIQTGTVTTSSASLSVARSDATATAYVDANGTNYVLIAGGTDANGQPLSSADLYNADADTVTPVQVSMSAARSGADSTLLPSGNILVVGGQNGAQASGYEAYDQANFTGGDLLTNRTKSTVDLLGGQAIAVAGRDMNGAALADIEYYDTSQTTPWNAANAALSIPRAEHVAVSAGGNVLVVGGVDSQSANLASTEIISGQATNLNVQAGPTMTVARKAHTATLLQSGNVLVAGGLNASGQPLASAEVMAPNGQTVPGSAGTITPGPTPNISALNPTQGPVGTVVTISGTNFDPAAANNIVRLNGVGMAVQSVSTAQATHTITAVVPNGATTGNVTVTVKGQTSNGMAFTVQGSSSGGGSGGSGTGGATGPIRVWLVFPTNLKPLIPVSITGTGFTKQAIPYFGGTPSMSLLSFQLKKIPLIGSVSEMVTITPLNAQKGQSQLWIEDNGFVSNKFSITVN